MTSRYVVYVIIAIFAVFSISLVIHPVNGQVGPSNPNANVTTAYKLLQNSTLTTTPPIIVTTDLKSYNQGDTIIIKGAVRQLENETAITIRVFNSIKNLISIGQFIPTSSGGFSDTIKANGPLWTQAGNYTVIAQYGRYQNAPATFHYSGGNGQIITNIPVIKDSFQINAGGQTYSVPYIIKG